MLRDSELTDGRSQESTSYPKPPPSRGPRVYAVSRTVAAPSGPVTARTVRFHVIPTCVGPLEVGSDPTSPLPSRSPRVYAMRRTVVAPSASSLALKDSNPVVVFCARLEPHGREQRPPTAPLSTALAMTEAAYLEAKSRRDL